MAIGFHLDDMEEAYFSDPQKMYELNQEIRNLKKQLKTARVEAVKEFAERLKAEAIAMFDEDNCIDCYTVDIEDIDNLVKEIESE